VNFHVEPAVDGQQRLVLEVWTDGSVAPTTAVAEASRIVEDHFELLTNFPQATPEGAAAKRDETRPRTERNENLLRSVDGLAVILAPSFTIVTLRRRGAAGARAKGSQDNPRPLD